MVDISPNHGCPQNHNEFFQYRLSRMVAPETLTMHNQPNAKHT
jgi:hypothetical protein